MIANVMHSTLLSTKLGEDSFPGTVKYTTAQQYLNVCKIHVFIDDILTVA